MLFADGDVWGCRGGRGGGSLSLLNPRPTSAASPVVAMLARVALPPLVPSTIRLTVLLALFAPLLLISERGSSEVEGEEAGVPAVCSVQQVEATDEKWSWI